ERLGASKGSEAPEDEGDDEVYAVLDELNEQDELDDDGAAKCHPQKTAQSDETRSTSS
ncbi:hypothetical protein FRC04_003509, partial [Tulasnella sp. 424]